MGEAFRSILLHPGESAVKTVLKRVASVSSCVPGGARAIFVMHDISAPSEHTFSPSDSTPPELFERQLDFFQERFTFVPLGSLLASREGGRASLTFDDGFLTVLTRAYPILKRREIPFTVFCNGRAMREGRLDFDPRFPSAPQHKGRIFLDESDVRELSRAGAGIGSHGATHASLAGLDAPSLAAEIGGNKTYLEGVVGKEVIDFAFPYGKARDIEPSGISACVAAGHQHLYSAIPGYLPREASGAPAVLPRISLHLQEVSALHLLLNRLALRHYLGWP